MGTPHMAKGTNLAIHDAFALACAAATAQGVAAMLQNYSHVRARESAQMLLFSRHLGRVRNGLAPNSKTVPLDGRAFDALVRSANIRTATLPTAHVFQPIWEFVQQRVPEKDRGFFLQ